jgi:uncharacterized membrane protein
LIAGLLLAAGVTLIVLAVLERTVEFSLVVVVPVFFSSSWELPVGVLLVMGGVFATFVAVAEAEPVDPAGAGTPAEPSTGGVLVIGPVPIFLGSLRRLSRRARWIVTIVTVATFVVLFAAFWFIA